MDNMWYIFDEYYWDGRTKGVRLLREHAKEILSRTTDRWSTAFARVWADHDAQDRAELNAGGVGTWPAVKDVLPGIESVQSCLKVRDSGGAKRPRLMVSDRCANTLRELATYHWADPTETYNPREEPVGKDDHTCDAVRYIIHSEGVATPTRRITLGDKYKRTY